MSKHGKMKGGTRNVLALGAGTGLSDRERLGQGTGLSNQDKARKIRKLGSGTGLSDKDLASRRQRR